MTALHTERLVQKGTASDPSDVAWPDTVSRVVICIGAQKAGTSFLFRELARHRDICVPPKKEVHYWDSLEGRNAKRFRRRARRGLATAMRQNGWRAAQGDTDALAAIKTEFELVRMRHMGLAGRRAYRNLLLKDYDGEPVVFEATPGYALAGAEVFRQMGRIAPDTTLIFVMRDPVERMWSAAKYFWRDKLASGAMQRSDVQDFFLSRIAEPTSIGYRHSAYDVTLAEIEKAGLSDHLQVAFVETLSTPSETAAVGAAVGLELTLDHSEKANTHNQHFPLDDDAKSLAVLAFSATYENIRARFGSRVPATWHA